MIGATIKYQPSFRPSSKSQHITLLRTRGSQSPGRLLADRTAGDCSAFEIAIKGSRKKHRQTVPTSSYAGESFDSVCFRHTFAPTRAKLCLLQKS